MRKLLKKLCLVGIALIIALSTATVTFAFGSNDRPPIDPRPPTVPPPPGFHGIGGYR